MTYVDSGHYICWLPRGYINISIGLEPSEISIMKKDDMEHEASSFFVPYENAVIS